MSINFTGRDACPHVGASASSLVFEKVVDALDKSEENLTATEAAKNTAVEARDAAILAQSNAEKAKDAAESWAKGDTGTRAGEETDNSKYYAERAKEAQDDAVSAKGIAESWAKGGTGTRTGEDIDNAKYYAEESKKAKGVAESAKTDAEHAASTAQQYSGKPAKAINGTWWTWNAETGEYVDSGASSVLSIQHSYTSVEAMNADFGNTKKNDMAIISSSVEEEDTAKLYINNGTEWLYLCDLSGVQGAKGDAATVSVGTVATGASGSAPSVTNVGTSAAAVLNFVIPKGDTGEKGATGDTGVGITGITQTAGNHAAGTLDTYTVLLTNGETFSFQVYNGQNGNGSGDFMANGSVSMTGDLNADGHKVTNLAAPVADTDAVRKSDLDSLIISSATEPTSQTTNGLWYKVLS